MLIEFGALIAFLAIQLFSNCAHSKTSKIKNDLHIAKVLLGLPEKANLNPLDSTLFGSFNTSSSCNINVLCPEGTAWANERKAICLIETNDGVRASGFLISNTCYTNRPYVITAWHVTDNRNPTQWTYIFGWWSSTCTPNTNNQQALLFNGATLRATYEPTDFSLLELFQTPSLTSDLSYLGWSRSSTIPATSVGIHHPSGDQMKISFANNPATIGNVRLNTNTAWRVLWNSGTVQPGSSGSPLFDPNKKVIGQAFSTTQPAGPPCNQQSGGTNYGRFDLSWTGGGTNSTRLSNWLDPNNTGAMITNTTNVANLSGTNYSISGPDYFCATTQQYSLVGGSIPPGVNVFWESSNNSIATVAPIGNGSSATVTKVANGNVTITASISGCIAASKAITVGPPAISITATPSSCSGGEYQQWNLVNNTPSNGTNWNWSVSYLTPNSDIVIYSPSSASTWISVKGGGTVRLNYTDLCGGSKQDGLTVYSTCGGYYTLAVSPNPAQENITVSLSPSDKSNTTLSSTTKNSSLITIDSKGKTILSLFEMNTGLLVKQWKFNESKNKNYNLSINGLRKGVYALQADRENHSVITKLIIE